MVFLFSPFFCLANLNFFLTVTQAKAFDKKTSVLQYLIKVIGKNDPELLKLKDEIISIDKAKDMMLDSLLGDLKQLTNELEEVKKAAEREGEKNRGENGKLTVDVKVTVAELKEQKTSNRIINGVKFFNQMESEKEFIPMEMFAQSAEYQVLSASEKIEEVKTSFSSVLNYFGEDEKMTSADFFGTLSRFLQSFESEKDLFEQQEEIRIRDEKRLAIQMEKDAKNLAVQRAKERKDDLDSDVSYDNVQTSKDSKRKKKIVTIQNSKDIPNDMKGLAAAAAQAALKKKQTPASPNESIPKNGPMSPMRMGGVAAMAAAAALKKKQKAEASESTSTSGGPPERPANPMGMGGIAAMVAAAALKKQQKAESSESSSNSDPKESPPKRPANPMGMGGIAAMAVAAALKKQQKAESSESISTSDQGPPERPANPMGMGGIAAMVAAAALKKEQKAEATKSISTSDQSPPERPANPMGMGGIADMAVAAALKKQQKAEALMSISMSDQSPPKKPANPMGMGGIAAMAAAAALKKQQKAEALNSISISDPKDIPPPERPSNPMGMGGIAAMAAAAALKRQEKNDGNLHSDTAVKTDMIDNTVASDSSIYDNVSYDGNSLEGCDSMDSDMTYSTSKASHRKKSSKRSTTSNADDHPMSKTTHLVRPIARRATADQMGSVAQELAEDNHIDESSDSDDSALQAVNSMDANVSYDNSYTLNTTTPAPKPGRHTFNSTILRPKAIQESVDDGSEADSKDDDQVAELPNRSKSIRGNLLAAFEDDLAMIESKDSNESDVSYGTVNSTATNDTIQTVQTIQSYARKTGQAYDALTDRLIVGSQSTKEISGPGNEENDNEPSLGSRPAFNPIGIGGIAAAAAQAALKRNQDKDIASPAFNGGGIAAAAAAAARKRNKKTSQSPDSIATPSSASDCRDDDSTSSISTMGVGHSGIATAAAQAALARMKSVPNDSDIDGTMLNKKIGD